MSTTVAEAGDTAFISIATGTANDTLIAGLQNRILVRLDTKADTVLEAELVFLWTFTGNNFIGALCDTGGAPNVLHSELARETFAVASWNAYLGSTTTNPDTTWAAYREFGSAPYWTGSGELHSLLVTPSDIGRFTIGDTFVPGTLWRTQVVLADLEVATIVWDSSSVLSVRCTHSVALAGDANYDRSQTSADIIYLVNYIFKAGTRPALFELADTNCSGAITAADMITLINFIFKMSPLPCDVCD